MSLFLKDPDARVDYAIDWSAYLGSATIVASAWSVTPVEPAGISIDAESFAATTASVTLAGGVAGHVYRLENRVNLSNGNVDDRSLFLRVEQR